MKNFLRIALVSVLAVASLAAFTTTATASAKARPLPVKIFNLTDKPLYKPADFFLTANSGPYLTKLKWRDWGSRKTVGRGRFISDCASCGPYENKQVTFTLSGIEKCGKYRIRTYKHAVIHVIDPERRRVLKFALGCL